MSEIFENEIDESSPIKIEKGKGKHKKEMTSERKAALTEQLKKARAVSQAKRTAKAKEKKLQKLKIAESKVPLLPLVKESKALEQPVLMTPLMPEVKEPDKKVTFEIKEPEETLETKIEKRLRLKLEKEYENSYDHKLKDYKILSLQERLNDYKETKKMKIIKEEIEEAKPPPKPKVIDNISPSKNLMDKYRKIRDARGY